MTRRFPWGSAGARLLVPVAGLAWILAVLALAPGSVDAARAKADLDVTFGPVAVPSRSAATFVLSVRNRGAADATLALGDRFEVLYGSGDVPTALVADGSSLAAQALPAEIVEQEVREPGGALLGTRLAVQAPLAIPAGGALVVAFDGTTSLPGAAPVVVDLLLSKSAGKFPRRSETRVVKSPARGEPFFGDGAAGALTVTADADLQPLASYTDVTIAAGVTVTVPSGATIRLTGDFENRGTIVVRPGASGGGALTPALAAQSYDPLKELAPLAVDAGRGEALVAAWRPAVMQQQAAFNTPGGRGLGTRVHGLPLSHYRQGGGGGSGALGAIGGDGGGLLRILAGGEVRNGGTISATGSQPGISRAGVAGGGGGGGAGGIVILAAGVRVRNDVPANANGAAASGTIDVRGAPGGPADARGAGGGGGGGGLVVFAAPLVGANATVLLEGGASNPAGSPVPSPFWAAGGGGGACVGDGGDGLSVSDLGAVAALPDGQGGFLTPNPAQPGLLVIRTADPRTLW